MDYRVDTSAFLIALTSIQSPSMEVKRSWDTYYRGSTCAVWNYRLWLAVLAVDEINGDCIDKYEFERLDSDNKYLTSQLDKVFNSMNSSSRSLQYSEFDCFLSLISFYEYDRLMDTLSIKQATPPPSPRQPPPPPPSPDSDQSSPLYPLSSSSSLTESPSKPVVFAKAARVPITETCLRWIRERMRSLRERWCSGRDKR